MNPIRQALEGDRSVLVDIETFDLGKGSPTHEISILHASKGKAVEIVPKPMGVRSLVPGVDPIRAPVDKRKVQEWDSWTDALADNPDSYAAKHKDRYPHLRGKSQKRFRKVKYGDDVVRVKHIAGLSAKEALSTTLDLIKNKTVWIANVPFEASRLGLMAEVTGQARRVTEQATYGGKNPFQSLLVSDPGVLDARIRAHRTGDWTGVYEAMKKVDFDAKGTKVFDIQDLVRATQSYGDKVSRMAGLGLDFSEVYQGTSLNVQARLLGLPPEAHTSVKDNILAKRVGLKMLDHIEALEGTIAQLHGATGAALNPTSQGQKDALDWLYRMHSFKQKARTTYLDQRLARAHVDIVQNKISHGVYTGESVYKTTKSHKGKNVISRVGVPIITDMNGMDEVVGHLSSRPEYSGIDVQDRYRKIRDGATGDPASYFKSFENSASNNADAILDQVMADKPNFKFGQSIKTPSIVTGPRFDPRVGRLSGHEYLKSAAKKTGLGLGLLALTGVIGASSRISSSDDEYNTIEGMGEDNYAAYLRHGSTDFGSGWRNTVGMLLAGSVIGGGFGINAELAQGPGKITAQTTISGTTTVLKANKPLEGVSVLMMEEVYDDAPNGAWSSTKKGVEKYGAKIFPVGPNYPLDEALAAVNANTGSNRVFILSHGNNGTAIKFTGAGERAHENIVASLGYINNRLDSRFTVDLGACNAQYLLNFDELDTKLVNKNLDQLGSHAPNAWYNEASNPDNLRKFRAGDTHGVGLGAYSLMMGEADLGGWTTTPASGALDDIASAEALIGRGVSYNEYVSGNGTAQKINQAFKTKVLDKLDKPNSITLNKYVTGNNADEVMDLMGMRLRASGQLGAGLGGFAAGLASLAGGLAGRRKGLTNTIKSAAVIPTTWTHKGLAGLTSAKNFAGRTGQSIMGSVNSTGKNFRNFATSTGQVVGTKISAGAGSVRAGLTKTKNVIGGKIGAAQDWTRAKRVSTVNSIGRMKGQLISASSLAQTSRRPRISMPRSPGALASASISERVESTLSGPAHVNAGSAKRLETTRYNKSAAVLNNPSIGSYDLGHAANNSFGFESRPSIGSIGVPNRVSRGLNYHAGKTRSMGVASVVAGSGRRIEQTTFGSSPIPPGHSGNNYSINKQVGRGIETNVGFSRILPKKPVAASYSRPSISMPRSPGPLAPQAPKIGAVSEATTDGIASVNVGRGRSTGARLRNASSLAAIQHEIPSISMPASPGRLRPQSRAVPIEAQGVAGPVSIDVGRGTQSGARLRNATSLASIPIEPVSISMPNSPGPLSPITRAVESVSEAAGTASVGVGSGTPTGATLRRASTLSPPVKTGVPKRNYMSGTGGTSRRNVAVAPAPSRSRDFGNINDALWDDSVDKATTARRVPKTNAKIEPPVAPTESVKVGSSAPVQPSSKTPSRNYKSPSAGTYTRQGGSQPLQAAVQAAPKPGPTSHAVSKAGRSMWGLGVAAAAIAAVGLGAMMFSGKGSEYNDNPGLSEQGVAAGNRKHSTDFGSPYQGIWGSVSSQIAGSLANGGSTPNYVNGVPINQEVSDFRDQQMQTPLQKQIIEAEMTKQSLKSMNRLYFLDPALTTQVASGDYGLSGTKQLQHVNLSQVDWSVEDADTIVLKQGVRGLMGQEMQIRLAGIDAPEVQHNDESMDMLRYKQGQPHGEAARDRLKEILTSAKNVEIVSDPGQATYGRGLGVLFADGENVNLQLIREGHVAALPFGQRSADLLNRDAAMNAERGAYQSNRGMWQNDYWRTYRESVSEYSRITFNTLSRVDKLAGNMNLAGLEATMSMAQEQGQNRLTDMSSNSLRPKLANIGKKREFKDNTFTVDYHTQAKHLDQLKFETKNHMSNYGAQLGNERMSTSTHHISNQMSIGDSMSPSTSIYNDELPTIIDKYTRKAGKRKLQAESQRAANKFMNTKNRYGGE
jgi:endonuclease YncB( thermonuclease family)